MSVPPDQQHKINALLAQSMGYQLKLTINDLPNAHIITPDGERQPLSKLPNFFTSAEDNRALVEWLAEQDDDVIEHFNSRLEQCIAPYGGFSVLAVLNTSLETITLAAAAALGIDVSE